MQTRDQIRKKIRDLSADINHLEVKLDAATDSGNDLEAESVERILGTKEGLLAEQQMRDDEDKRRRKGQVRHSQRQGVIADCRHIDQHCEHLQRPKHEHPAPKGDRQRGQYRQAREHWQ